MQAITACYTSVPHILEQSMERFWSKVEKTETCWNWIACKNPKGYGEFRFKGAKKYAHRFSFYLKNGKFPDDCLLHKCDNPSCVNPEHLFEGSRADNNRDMWNKGRGSCKGRASGINHPRAKPINADMILDMRKINMTYRQIQSATGYPMGTITRVIRGDHWSCRR